MIIKTTRFGEVTIQNEDLLTFPEGLLGFQDLRSFVLLDDPNDDIFAWLQSCELPSIAFPILEPEIFGQTYTAASLTKSEAESLKLQANQAPAYMNIITIPDDPTQMTANLKAPIVINQAQRVARQCVLQDNHLAIREPIFVKLQSRVVQNPETSIKSLSKNLDFAVKIEPVQNTFGQAASAKTPVDQEL